MCKSWIDFKNKFLVKIYCVIKGKKIIDRFVGMVLNLGLLSF